MFLYKQLVVLSCQVIYTNLSSNTEAEGKLGEISD